MQNLFGSAGQIRQGAFTMGPAAKKVALLDTRDVAAVAVAALTEPGHSGQIYDLNGPELLDGYAQAAVFSDVLGRPVDYLDVSVADFIENLKKHGLPDWLIEAFSVSAADAEFPGDPSNATVERILHRKPGSLAQFVTLHSFRFIGLAFIAPGVTGPDLPTAFSHFAAYCDLATSLLAILALMTVKARAAFWVFVAAFNIVGLLDILTDYFHAIQHGVPAAAGQLGATFFIVTLLVPLLVITNVYLLYSLVRSRPV